MSAVLHIACAARRDYLPHSAVMLHSLLAHRDGHHVKVHFLHGPDVGDRERRRLACMVERLGSSISFLGVSDERMGNLATHDHLPTSHWYRVFLPELLPDIDRVLYLDVDIVVVDSVAELWATPLGDHYLAAVTNVFQPDHVGLAHSLGVPPGDYFNSGVLLMDLAALRRDGCMAAVLDWAAGRDLFWPEQDALNVVLGERRLPLHPRWNCMNSILAFPWSEDVFGREAVEEARRRPAVRHFEGPSINKPWHLLCDPAARAMYREHRRQTPWPRYRPSGLTPANLVRRLARSL